MGKKDQMHVENRLKNIRFLGECLKFRLVSTAVVFNAFKALLEAGP